jgi:hypothetical protein
MKIGLAKKLELIHRCYALVLGPNQATIALGISADVPWSKTKVPVWSFVVVPKNPDWFYDPDRLPKVEAACPLGADVEAALVEPALRKIYRALTKQLVIAGRDPRRNDDGQRARAEQLVREIEKEIVG